MKLLFTVALLSSCLFGIGQTQSNAGSANRYVPGSNPSRGQPTNQPSATPYRNFMSPYNPNSDYKPSLSPEVNRPQNPVRTASNLLYPQPIIESNMLVAQIHGNGVFGFASFHPAPDGGSHVVIDVTGGNPGETYAARIYELPLQNGASCTPISLGGLIKDLSEDNGILTPGKELRFKDKNLKIDEDPNLTERNLFRSTLIGRTLMLQGLRTGVQICSVIMPGDRRSKLVLQGKFHVPIAGMVYYIQNEVGAALGSEWMMYSDGTRKATRHRWELISSPSNSVEDKVEHEKTFCNRLTGKTMFESPEANFPVSTETPIWGGRMHVGLPPLVTDPSEALYLKVFGLNNTAIACTSLNRIDPKVAAAIFASKEVVGNVTFVQDSPYEPTRVNIDLELKTNAFSYGIDVLPSIRRRKVESQSCPNVKQTIYNPFHIDPESVPAQGQGTTDQYATGDLSGKFGTLQSQPRIDLRTWDVNLPMFGYYSVVGRAIVIYSPDGKAVACANIDLQGKLLTTAYSTFDAPIQGQFIFRQPKGECFSDTYIYIEVSKPATAGNVKTFNHNWHVHKGPVTLTGDRLSTENCGPAGPHFNPYNVSMSKDNCIYQRDCSIFTPVRCEIGDTAAKVGTIDIPPYKPVPGKEPEVAKYYFIDSDLPVCGSNRIIGKAVAIHQSDFQKPKISCANIFEFQSKS